MFYGRFFYRTEEIKDSEDTQQRSLEQSEILVEVDDKKDKYDKQEEVDDSKGQENNQNLQSIDTMYMEVLSNQMHDVNQKDSLMDEGSSNKETSGFESE